MGRKGGRARALALTAKQRSDIAKMGAEAWAKSKAEGKKGKGKK